MKQFIIARRKWIIRGLTVAAAISMIVSFSLVWWTADFGSGQTVQIFGWGLRDNLPVQLAAYITAERTPVYQTVIAWVYLSLSVIMILISAFIQGKKRAILLGIAGTGYIIYALVAVFVVISNKISEFNVPLQGIVRPSALVSIHTSIYPGFYLACFTGAAYILLALFYRAASR
jgi:hypothetical protein